MHNKQVVKCDDNMYMYNYRPTEVYAVYEL